MLPAKTSVLVVDDDVRMLRMMRRILELEGYRPVVASDGEAALNIFYQEPPDLVLLDVAMPGLDGYNVCRRICESSQVPVIMVTCKGNDEEKVAGLDAGADDYVTKPFSFKELTARIKAVLRRAGVWEDRPEPVFPCHDLVIDFAAHRVTLGDQDLSLSATEYRLLSYLARNADRVLTSDQILQKVWGDEYIGEPHLLQVNIGRIRHKLRDDPRNPSYILTRAGMGYTMIRT